MLLLCVCVCVLDAEVCRGSHRARHACTAVNPSARKKRLDDSKTSTSIRTLPSQRAPGMPRTYVRTR